MLTRTTNRAGALVTAIVVLTGVAMLPHDSAAADPTDDQFVSLLDQKGIPALDNIPSLIGTAHRICHQLDGGMPVDGVVDDLRERAFKANPGGGQYPADRVARTIARFISASVEAYCPNNQPKIASLQGVANRVPGPSEPTVHTVSVRLASLTWAGPFPAGETPQPDPPQLPPSPGPTAQILAPPPPVATPSPRQQAPAPAQEPQPGPQQGPTVAPAPAGPPSGDTPPTPPGRVRLAP
ncbi:MULTISPECIES: DUF732 domain-containing protein [unclassified Mycobacterium]|uniref:DUF732 domain-containing protein n=1 Tax=unclassified Mycobacterium TaxID=2642494 RepID=UPI0006DCCEE2|nr:MULTISPECIES: DUF732 domain-containing protein [unclassified Mycobacterium]OBG61414.1 hypothetical protein A5702_02655 [Mycobacterium sp. E3339]OBH82385.1 hypothetical protein A5680_13865 [Mycobacterium sp. E2989]